MPGLVDTHIHAPQYVFTGTGYDLPLLQWLEKYTFPSESKFGNKEFAEHAYRKVVVSSFWFLTYFEKEGVPITLNISFQLALRTSSSQIFACSGQHLVCSLNDLHVVGRRIAYLLLISCLSGKWEWKGTAQQERLLVSEDWTALFSNP